VRSAGYVSEEEATEDEGSSVEEEQDEVDVDEDRHLDIKPPSYSNPPSKNSEVELGANGFVIEKASNHYDSSSHGGGGRVGRKSSQRRREKAPEGRNPHVSDEDWSDHEGDERNVSSSGPGPIPAEGRFAEVL
jgi:hypothetical protein